MKITIYGWSTTYLGRLQEQPITMYAAVGPQSQRTIARLWDVTIEAIRTRNLSAIKLLHILACYAPDAVPRIILGGNANTNKLAVDEALAVLASYSMITLTADSVSMHRLVQAVILSKQPPEGESPAFGKERPLAIALMWLADAIPANPGTNMAGWPLLRALIAHAESLGTRFPPDNQPEKFGVVQNELAIFQRSQGQYEQALALHRSAVAISEATHGPDHPDTATMLNNMGLTYQDLGQADKALPLQQRALEITEATLGPDHPSTAIRLNNLATTYLDLEQADKALPLQQRALEITEATLGPDHPSTAIRLNNLATAYRHLGQADKALPLQERDLNITEATLGPDHPYAAITLMNLAITYRHLGQADKALPLQQRALEITEATLGPDHPQTATALTNLATTYIDLGQVDKALPLQQRAVEITEATPR